MTDAPQRARGRHLLGLLYVAVLGGACYGVYLFLPALLRGTILADFGNLATFAAIVALLSSAERLWVVVTSRWDGPSEP